MADPTSILDDGQGAYVSLEGLRRLEGNARQLSFLPRQPSRSVLSGRHASKLRGRGINFEEIRNYLPGDDIRTVDWKVTARLGEPHIRVYTEERDRPALIVVDQRMSMFFGSVLNLKSVTAAEAAALAGFAILRAGDRVGGIVFGDRDMVEIRPQRSQRTLNAILKAIVNGNRALRADVPPVARPMPIDQPLEAAAQIARHDHTVLVFSDFDGIGANTRRILSGLARHNNLVLVVVTDPLAQDLPRNLRLVVSDGDLQAEIDTSDGRTHQSLHEVAAGRVQQILAWERELGIPVLPLTSSKETVGQIRRLMGRAIAPKMTR
ncbi:MAG: DUF58 domain-containing protein [Pseudomonadota bacterium]